LEWAGEINAHGKTKNEYKLWFESLKTSHSKDLGADAMKLIKWILAVFGFRSMDWIHLALDVER
jgi:hypothetical protein